MNRYTHLDSLRGIAAVLVLWMHGAIILSAGMEESLITLVVLEVPGWLHFGRVGVVIFFGLSGYLIAKSLEKDNWKVAFPIKRALRLYPIYLASILAVLFLIDPDWSPARLLANVTMVPTLFGQIEYMGLYWTLQTEVIFYAIFYLVAWMGLGSSVRFLFVAAGVLNTLFIIEQLWVEPAYLESLHLMIKKLPQHLAIMFWGACLYKTRKEDYFSPRVLILTGYLLLPSLVAAFEFAQSGFAGGPPVIQSYATAVTMCFLVFRFHLSVGIFAPIGRISYSVYLNHAIVLFLYAKSGMDLGLVGGMIVFTSITLVLSWVTYALIEAPAIRLSRGLVDLTTRRRIVPVAGG